MNKRKQNQIRQQESETRKAQEGKQDHTTDHLINREAAGLFIHHRY